MFFSSNSRDNINGSNLWINDTLNYYYSIMSIMNVVSSKVTRVYSHEIKYSTPVRGGEEIESKQPLVSRWMKIIIIVVVVVVDDVL